MQTYPFTLILAGVGELAPALADALYAATDGDIELNLRDGVAFAEFVRTAATLREAITTAIREDEQATVGVRVVRLESESANVIAKINADLLGLASGSWTTAQRPFPRHHNQFPNAFPPPHTPFQPPTHP